MAAYPTDADCIICKIVAGTIPCYKVYEDDEVMAFLDIGPLVQGHTLVVPKAHYPTVMAMPAEVMGAVSARLPKVAAAVLAVTKMTACHILTNNGGEALQSISHVHFHILPRFEGDGFTIPWNAGKLSGVEGNLLAEAVAARLSRG